MAEKKEAPLPQNAEKLEPVSLETMLGSGEYFMAAGKRYRVKPMLMKDSNKFIADAMSITSQIFNLAVEERRNNLDKWLSACVTNEKGEPMSIDKATNDDWDLVDLKNCIRKMVDISG